MPRRVARKVSQQFSEIRSCEFVRQKILLAAFASVASAFALRSLVTIAAIVFPAESWAGDFAGRAVALELGDFYLACGIAGIGGAASLFHELRDDLSRFSIVNSFGHMVLAQFAGLLAYLLAVQYTLQIPISLVLCGAAGWGGNHSIVAINGAIVRRIGIEVDQRRRR